MVLTVIWRHNIADLIAKPFAALYDGGSQEPIPHPAYSVAQSNQKRGKYLEAVAEIRKQLERFPTDVEGQLLMAQIQAEDLKDMPAAELTIQRFCDQPGHAPQNIAFALYSMADWHLKIAQDREAARRDLEKIIELFPESEFALGAAHRIAHLGSAEMLLAPHERKKFIVTEGVQNLGLLRGQEPCEAGGAGPGTSGRRVREASGAASAGHGGAGKTGGHLCRPLWAARPGDRRVGANDRAAEPAGPAGRSLAELAGRSADSERSRVRGGPADAPKDCGSRPESRRRGNRPASAGPAEAGDEVERNRAKPSSLALTNRISA